MQIADFLTSRAWRSSVADAAAMSPSCVHRQLCVIVGLIHGPEGAGVQLTIHLFLETESDADSSVRSR